MEQIGLQAVLNDVNFQAGIKKYQGSIDTANTKTGGFKRALDGLNSQVPILGRAFALMTNPITLAVAGLSAFAAVAKESIGDTVAYNKEIRELTQVLGLSAEETSRVVQVADDWGISIEQVRGALSLMNKNGVTPSIDNLADLADEYVATADKTEFAEKAAKLLGRQYTTLIPLFAKGGDALREQAAAVDESLIATEESIIASREYEVAMDDLEDTIQGLKYEIGRGLIPELVKLLKIINDNTGTGKDFNEAMEEGRLLIERGVITQEEWDAAAKKTGFAINRQKFILDEVNPILDRHADLIDYIAEVEHKEANMRLEVSSVTEKSIPLVDSLSDKYGGLATGADSVRYSHQLMAEAVAESIETLNQRYNDMDLVINGKLGPTIEDFNEKQIDLKDEMDAVKGKIDILNRQEYLTEEQKGELSDLHFELGDLKDEYDENATAHEEATRRILWDILMQRIAVADLSNDQREVLLPALQRIAEQWGLNDDATATAMLSMDSAINGFVEGDSIAEFMGILREAETTINGISGLHEVTLDIIVTGDTIPDFHGRNAIVFEEDEGPGGQHGLNFVVPPGFPNDSFPFRASSGEHVSVTPMSEMGGSTISNHTVSTHNSRNINISMGNVNISNGMDYQSFISQIEYAVGRALGV